MLRVFALTILVFTILALVAGQPPTPDTARLRWPSPFVELEATERLIVRVEGVEKGAGIVLGTAEDRLLVVSARHVVALSGTDARAKVPLVTLRWNWDRGRPLDPAFAFPARVLRDFEDLDLVYLEVPNPSNGLVSIDTIPGAPMKDVGLPLDRSDGFLAGHPGGELWYRSRTPGSVIVSETGQLRLELVSKVENGYSGGPLLASNGRVVGLIQTAQRDGRIAGVMPIGVIVANAPPRPIQLLADKTALAIADVVLWDSGLCVTTVNGAGLCWGSHPALPGKDPLIGGGVRQISVSNSHICLLRNDGGVWCRGIDRKNPTLVRRVTSVQGVISLVSGDGYTCAIAGAEKEVSCWGANGSGQLGVPGKDYNAVFEEPVKSGVKGVERLLAAGNKWTCAVDGKGVLWCWGGRFLSPRSENSICCVTNSEPTQDEMQGGRQVLALAVGDDRGCVVLDDGSTRCWGVNHYGETGSRPLDRKAAIPEPRFLDTSKVPGRFAEISVSGQHSCALDRKGQAWCWGRNDKGQLGDGTRKDSKVPRQVGRGVDGSDRRYRLFSKIRVSGTRTCALELIGDVWCWGEPLPGVATGVVVSPNKAGDERWPQRVKFNY
jgi:hypothetical protein